MITRYFLYGFLADEDRTEIFWGEGGVILLFLCSNHSAKMENEREEQGISEL